MYARPIPVWPALAVLLGALVFALAALSSSVYAQTSAPTASDLLEKAIYTEETVGNLDEAMKLYEQVIAEGKTAQAAAAQAQYRLALCYQKKNMKAEATAAFQKLIETFPGETDLVAKARKELPSGIEMRPVPWPQHEQMHMHMKLATGIDVGVMVYMVDAVERDGKPHWRTSTRGLVTLNGASSFSDVLCAKDTFAPVRSHWKHTMLGNVDAVYKDASVEITTVGKKDSRTIVFTPPAYDNEQCLQLFRRLPLEVGSKTKFTVISTLGGGAIPLEVEATGKETLEVPAGKFECNKLVLNIGQTFWVSTDEHHYVVRFAAGGVTADLVKIEQRKPDENETIRGDDFSIKLPPGWYSYAPKANDGKAWQKVHLLDPRGDAMSALSVGPKSKLKEAEQQSPSAWTTSAFEDVARGLKDFQIREPGVRETKIGDQPAAEVLADYTQEGKKMVMYGVAVFGKQAVGNVQFSVEADKFEALRSQFEEIAKSLELK